MSLREPEPGLKTQFERTLPGASTRKRRERLSRRRFGLMVTLLEERTLLSTPTLTTLALSSSSLTYGQNELFTATVTTDPPGGTAPTGGVVTFKEGTATLGTKNLVSGTATFSTQALPAGTDVVSAVYGGTSTYGGSASASTSSIINTVAGGGNPADRQALYTTLTDPAAVALDGSGDLFIADSYDEVVRELNASTGAVTTVAGDGVAGYLGDSGQATDAELNDPQGLAVNGSGDLFIADAGNNVIREVNLNTGIIATIAGTFYDSQRGGSFSGDGGPATAAYLNDPTSIALDSAGNLYIADTYNEVIREVVAATGDITTVAGTYSGQYQGGYSGDGGPATAAKLNNPSGVAVDSSGDLFIADTYNDIIREVSATTKVIKTIGGTDPSGSGSSSNNAGYSGDGGPATAAKLNDPQGIFVTSSGDLYFTDTFNSAIREINSSTGIISTVAGNGTSGYTGDGGAATNAELTDPGGLTLDSAGDIFIADTYNSVVREVAAASGNISTLAGGLAFGYTGDGGPASSAELEGPTSVGVDGAGNVYIADTSNNVVREVNAGTGQISTVAGGGQPVYHPVADPADPAIDSAGDIFIAVVETNEVDEISHATGEVTVVAGDGLSGYSGDNGQATAAELDDPTGLAIHGEDLFIADSFNNVVREVNLQTGIITTFAGTYNGGVGGYSGDNGLATLAELNGPLGIAVDSSGNLYIADSNNNVIREVNATSGDISTVAGNYGEGEGGYGGDNGPATAAQLDDPQGVAVDSSGDIFIADTRNDLIREVNATTQKITTVAGKFDSTATSTYSRGGYSGDGGPATAAKLNGPQGIYVSGGSLYIADSNNDAVREVKLGTGIISTVAGATRTEAAAMVARPPQPSCLCPRESWWTVRETFSSLIPVTRRSARSTSRPA